MLGSGMFATHNPATVWADDSVIFFDGINDYAQLDCASTINLAGKNTSTLSIWAQTVSTTINADFVIWQHREHTGLNEANQYLWYDESEEQIKFTRTDTNGANAATSISSQPKSRMNSFNHYVVTIDKTGDMVIYINARPPDTGGSDVIAQSPGAWGSAETKIFYGCFNVGPFSNFFKGYISNIAIWTVQLDTSQIEDVHNGVVGQVGNPKNELTSQVDNVHRFLYHVSNERHFNEDGTIQFVSFAPKSGGSTMGQAILSGAIIVGKP